MSRRLGRDADDVHIVLHRLLCRLFGRLEKRADIHIEADIGKRRGNDLGAPIVAVLAELDHEDAGPASLLLGETFHFFLNFLETFVARICRTINAGD